MATNLGVEGAGDAGRAGEGAERPKLAERAEYCFPGEMPSEADRCEVAGESQPPKEEKWAAACSGMEEKEVAEVGIATSHPRVGSKEGPAEASGKARDVAAAAEELLARLSRKLVRDHARVLDLSQYISTQGSRHLGLVLL